MLENDEFKFDGNTPHVLILGSLPSSGYVETITELGLQYKRKDLNSKPSNWQSIIDLINDNTVAILARLNEFPLRLIVRPDYVDIAEKLFNKIGTIPHFICIYEGLSEKKFELGSFVDYIYEYERLTGMRPSDISHARSFFNQVNSENYDELINNEFHDLKEYVNLISQEYGIPRLKGIEKLYSLNLNVVQYKKNKEITPLIREFVLSCANNLLFKFYISSSQVFFREMKKFIELFKEYLTHIGCHSVKLEEQHTGRGTIYSFYGSESDKKEYFSANFDHFFQFMNACSTNDDETINEILKNYTNYSNELMEVLYKFRKEAKRLSLDIRHEAECKFLRIRQNIESDLIEYELTPSDINSLVRVFCPMNLEPINMLKSITRGSASIENCTIINNYDSQIIEKVEGIVAKEIRGNQHFGMEAEEIGMLINQYCREGKEDLKTSLSIIEDDTIADVEKTTSLVKLKNFLIALSKKGVDVGEKIAVPILVKYIEKKLGF